MQGACEGGKGGGAVRQGQRHHQPGWWCAGGEARVKGRAGELN